MAAEESIAASESDRGTRRTGNPSTWFIEHDTDVFICAALTVLTHRATLGID